MSDPIKFQTPAALLGLAADMIDKDWQPVWCPQRQSGSFSPEPGCTGGAPYPTVLKQPVTAHKLAFRPPEDVLVLDVDHYDGKSGMDTIDKAVAWLGPLPETYRVTSRGFGNPSGRYLYRKPASLLVTDSSLYQFGDEDGKTDVEIVRTGHRFSWAPGDYHYKNNELIKCYDEYGDECGLPQVAELPELPARWVSYFENPPLPQRQEVYTRPSDGADWWLSQADDSLAPMPSWPRSPTTCCCPASPRKPSSSSGTGWLALMTPAGTGSARTSTVTSVPAPSRRPTRFSSTRTWRQAGSPAPGQTLSV